MGLEDAWPRFCTFSIPSVMQSFIFEHITHLTSYIVTSEQFWFYVKCYKTRTNYACFSFWLPSNRATDLLVFFLFFFFLTFSLTHYFALLTELVNDILQNVRLCATDCKLCMFFILVA